MRLRPLKNGLYTEHRTAKFSRSSCDFRLINKVSALFLKAEGKRSQGKRKPEKFSLDGLRTPVILKQTSHLEVVVKS